MPCVEIRFRRCRVLGIVCTKSVLGVDKNALRCSSILPVFLPVVYNGGEGGVCGGERVDSIRHDSRDAESDAYQVLSTISLKSFLWDMGQIWGDGFGVLDQSEVLREYMIEKCVAMGQLGFASRLGSSG